MTTREACVAFATLLRAVADGTITPADAIAQAPNVEGWEGVPATWGSALVLLEKYASDVADLGDELPAEMRAYRATELQKLAGRIEERAPKE